MFRRSARIAAERPVAPEQRQPTSQSKKSSELAMKPKIGLLDLPRELLEAILSDLYHTSSRGRREIYALSHVNKQFKTIIDSIRYWSIDIKADLIKGRKDQNMELFARSLLRNPDLRPLPQIINFSMSLPRPKARKDSNYASPRKFLKKADIELLKNFLKEVCQMPIWDKFPGGQWLPGFERRISVEDGIGQAGSENAETRATKWFEEIMNGRQDAWVGLVMVLCPGAQCLGFSDWSLLTFNDTIVNGEDANRASSVLRAGANSQSLKQSQPHVKREDFKDGVLLNVNQIQLKDAGALQPLNEVFALLALPMVLRASLPVVDNSRPNQLFSMPDDAIIAFNLRYLDLHSSHCSTATLTNFLPHCPHLKSFAYTYLMKPGYGNSDYNHLTLLSTLETSCGKTLRVLVLALTVPMQRFAREELKRAKAAHFATFAGDIRLQTWKTFPSLVRLQVPIEYLLGPSEINPAFPHLYLTQTHLLDRLPPTLRTLEVPWGKDLADRHHIIFKMLADVIRRGVKKGGDLPNLKKLFIGEDVAEIVIVGIAIEIERNSDCEAMMEAALGAGVRVLEWSEGQNLLPKEAGGPGEEVDLEWQERSELGGCDEWGVLTTGGIGRREANGRPGRWCGFAEAKERKEEERKRQEREEDERARNIENGGAGDLEMADGEISEDDLDLDIEVVNEWEVEVLHKLRHNLPFE